MKSYCICKREILAASSVSQNTTFLTKRSLQGGSRTIEAPCSKMKKWQRRVWDLMARIEKPDWVISATKGKSYKDNASKHRSNGYVMTMDISSFYPSCVREYVFFARGLNARQMWRSA